MSLREFALKSYEPNVVHHVRFKRRYYVFEEDAFYNGLLFIYRKSVWMLRRPEVYDMYTSWNMISDEIITESYRLPLTLSKFTDTVMVYAVKNYPELMEHFEQDIHPVLFDYGMILK